MNRLTDIYLGSTHSQIVYDPLGRMTSKQADGTPVFTRAVYDITSKPHAIDAAKTWQDNYPSDDQTLTYTCFDKVKTITEGDNTLEYTYGYDHQRIRMASVVNDTIRCKDYVGMCEYITEDDGENVVQKTRTYLMGPFGVFAVVEQQDEEESIHYILKDHLGSWTTITDAEGNIEQELSFDAWGNLRDPENCSGTFSGSPMFDRGYTGHEHMTAFGLINMNGRCYDPLTSCFLSVDAYVQDPTNAQAFNRYAYCGHNPLRYIDPTGWYRDGYGYQNIQQNYDPTARWHSDDPNDVLWGRTVHPCANTSSGYVNGTPYTNTNYAQGNTGLNGCNYTVDKQGYVKNVGSNDKDCDILYTAEAYAAGDFSNGLQIKDTSLLPSFNQEDPYFDGNYVIRNDFEEMANLFLFMANNTEVEWRFDGYRTSKTAVNEYIVATSHHPKDVQWSTRLSKRFQEKNQIFDIHSHQGANGTKGASGAGEYCSGDMAVITNRHTRYRNNAPNDYPFTKHYVYHQYSKVLYEYTTTNSSIKRRTIKTYQDLLGELKILKR